MADSPCDPCSAPCCRKFTVSINGYDAVRLATGLHMPMSNFAELRWSKVPDRTHRILLSPAEGDSRRYWRLALKRIPDPDPRYERRCVFLHSVGELGRCAVYTLRPGICRTYPVFPLDDGKGFQIGGKYCPPGAWRLPVLDVKPFIPEVRLRARMDELYDRLIDSWNQKLVAAGETRTELDYFAHLMEEYTEMISREPSAFEPG